MIRRSDISMPDIVTFTAVAQTGSFTRAAEGLGTDKSNVGKAVQRLEKRLGTQLFQRTTRVIRLTEDGEIYLVGALTALDYLKEVEHSLKVRRSEPIGRVRLNLPASFGRLLLPTFAALAGRYPKLTLELAITDQVSDPVAEGWDIVVRIGELLTDSEMTVRKLCDTTFGLYASPDYIARRGDLKSVSDIANHSALIFRGRNGRLRPWTLLDEGHIREISPEPQIITSDTQVIIDAMVKGLGVGQILDRMAQPYICEGALVHLLPQSSTAGLPVHALIPSGQKMSAKTRVVLNHLSESLRLPAT
ncbi:LysR family transcriptional regulator [Pseudomonas sp. SZMC_28357]|uniref:LysR family transcriptional regulator n=1 Tax=Pseudomonas sp. SZMC_28357 TaxID=3074380 RepID=UPI002870FDEA|nr:LysR family transcriptional regulator [Pseudomonas sp. SZMC_28357]MDR9753368.1 LysR family transcriptional regulator [Pseudomonas sp. SZMC_28357]